MPSLSRTRLSKTGLSRKSATKARLNHRPAASNPKVAAAFSSHPKRIQIRLLALRQLILDIARTTDGVGALEETLKWGQVSYLTNASKSGSTIRIDRVKSEPDKYALYFHCQTNLVETFRELYPNLVYGGNRCILLDASQALPKDALRHCLTLALTYRLGENRGRRDRA
jgi:hypothetical protein